MTKMNILYAIDEKKKDYSRYLGVSILSLLENNKDENVNIYVLSEYIEKSNKEELIRIVEEYGKKIYFSDGKIIPNNFIKILSLRGGRPMATYYRFFFGEKFDIADRVLYLDCDTIVNKNLADFYHTDFNGNIITGSLDHTLGAYSSMKKYGLSKYINAGVCLIDIDSYKKVDMYQKILEINKRYGIPKYNDQDYINIIFQDKIKIYEGLQYLITNKRFNYKINDYLILHTINKPNIGGFSYCPKRIEKLFDKYLSKTKWEYYIGRKRKWSIKSFLGYIVYNIRDFIIYFSIKYIGNDFASHIQNGFETTICNILNLGKKLKLIE